MWRICSPYATFVTRDFQKGKNAAQAGIQPYLASVSAMSECCFASFPLAFSFFNQGEPYKLRQIS